MPDMMEEKIIEALKESTKVPNHGVILGIGDDAAVTEIKSDHQLVTASDVIALGTHYPEGIDPQSIGHRCLAVNLSDIAAMGATPLWANLIVSLPTVELDWINKFIEGFANIANQFNVTLIGGDTIHGPEFFAVSLQGVVCKDQYIARSGAQTDDLIYVSGQLGDASYGLKIVKDKIATEDNQLLVDKFLYPNPRIEEAKTISLFASSMIDLSDGLYSDLMKIMSESSVGVEVDVSKLPISALLSEQLSEEAAINHALLGGDDYELCFTLPVDREIEFLEAHRSLSDPLFTCIGKIREGSDLKLFDGKQDFVISEKPYNHF